MSSCKQLARKVCSAIDKSVRVTILNAKEYTDAEVGLSLFLILVLSLLISLFLIVYVLLS